MHSKTISIYPHTNYADISTHTLSTVTVWSMSNNYFYDLTWNIQIFSGMKKDCDQKIYHIKSDYF